MIQGRVAAMVVELSDDSIPVAARVDVLCDDPASSKRAQPNLVPSSKCIHCLLTLTFHTIRLVNVWYTVRCTVLRYGSTVKSTVSANFGPYYGASSVRLRYGRKLGQILYF